MYIMPRKRVRRKRAKKDKKIKRIRTRRTRKTDFSHLAKADTVNLLPQGSSFTAGSYFNPSVARQPTTNFIIPFTQPNATPITQPNITPSIDRTLIKKDIEEPINKIYKTFINYQLGNDMMNENILDTLHKIQTPNKMSNVKIDEVPDEPEASEDERKKIINEIEKKKEDLEEGNEGAGEPIVEDIPDKAPEAEEKADERIPKGPNAKYVRWILKTNIDDIEEYLKSKNHKMTATEKRGFTKIYDYYQNKSESISPRTAKVVYDLLKFYF